MTDYSENNKQAVPSHLTISAEVSSLLQGRKRKKPNAGPPSEEARKKNHKMIEQRRRQKINDKIEELREILSPNNSSGFPNKSAILESTIDNLKSLRGIYTKLYTHQKQLQEEHVGLEKELEGYGFKVPPIDFNTIAQELEFYNHPPRNSLDSGSEASGKRMKKEESDSEDSEEEDSEFVEAPTASTTRMVTRSSSTKSQNNNSDKEMLQNIIRNNSDISASQLASLFNNSSNGKNQRDEINNQNPD